jgi:hypothetical protein
MTDNRRPDERCKQADFQLAQSESGSYQMKGSLVALSVVAVSLVAVSASSNAETNPEKSRYRIRYPADAPVPNYLAMKGFGSMAAESPDFAVGVVKSELGYTATQAADLVQKIGGVYKTLESDEQVAAARIACTADSNTNDEEAYRLLDLIDDLHIALYQELYVHALAYIDEGSVQPVLDRIGNGMSVSFIYAKPLYDGGPVGRVQQDLAEMCRIGSSS